MEALARLFLESRLQLAFLSLVLAGVAYAAWLRAEGERRRRVWPATLALIALLFVIQELVETDRERIGSALDKVIEAIGRRDEAGVLAHVATDFRNEAMDRPGFERYLHDALRNVEVYDVRLGGRSFAIDEQKAQMTFTATATVRIQGTPARVSSCWVLQWVREASGWEIAGIRPTEVNGVSVSGLNALRAW
jgi:hypothetical protein